MALWFATPSLSKGSGGDRWQSNGTDLYLGFEMTSGVAGDLTRGFHVTEHRVRLPTEGHTQTLPLMVWQDW